MCVALGFFRLKSGEHCLCVGATILKVRMNVTGFTRFAGGGAACPASAGLMTAPCHALPGRVGVRDGVNQAYHLAQASRLAPAHGSESSGRQNKRMQQTRGGGRRVEASWSAIPRPAVIAGEGKVVRPSQLIRGVRPTVEEQHEEAAPGVSTAQV